MPPVFKTYELFVCEPGESAPHFEALTCANRDEVVPTVRRMIEQRNLSSVEVREMGVPLFTLVG